LPRNQTVSPPKEINGANGITSLYLRKFIDKPTKQYIAANTYEKPTANNIPIGPSQRASIATNFESPFPIASLLNTYLAKRLKISKIKNDIKEAPNPLNRKIKSLNSLLKIFKKIKPKKPEINPKFTRPWGIQRLSMSIKEIQTKSDTKNQLNNVLKNKFGLEAYKEGELFKKIMKRNPVRNSINGYLKDIVVLQVLHFPPCINQLIKGIFSRQVNWALQLGQKLLGFIIDKL